jgi:hypothetical protein
MLTITKEQVDSLLSAENLSEAEREQLTTAFYVFNPLELAKYLYRLSVPDRLKGELIRLKIERYGESQDDGLASAIELAAQKFWQRLGSVTK